MINLLTLLLLATPAQAQDCTVIDGATVHGAEGPVVIDGGTLGSPTGLGAPSGAEIDWNGRTCEFVDGTGLHVTAGLVDAVSTLGLIEVSLEGRSHNVDAGGDPIRASHVVVDSYNPRSTVVPVTRIEGTTTAIVHPRGGLMPGQAGAVQLVSGSQADAIAAPFVALPIALNARPSRSATLGWLRDVFDDARDRKAYDRSTRREPDAGDRDLAAIREVLSGAVPLFVGADRAADIEALLRFAAEQKVRLVIDGGAEAWLVAPQLAAADVPVIVHPYVYGAGSFDQVHGRADNPALLHEAGVTVLVASHSAHFARGLRQLAGNAVRGGLDHAAAIAGITSAPAAVFGLDDRGSLTAGKRADVVLWSGDPLEVTTSVKRLWIGGEDTPLKSRQTELLKRYRTPPGTPIGPLPLP